MAGMANIEDVVSMVKTVKSNLHSLMEDWKDFQHAALTLPPPPPLLLQGHVDDPQPISPATQDSPLTSDLPPSPPPPALHPTNHLTTPPVTSPLPPPPTPPPPSPLLSSPEPLPQLVQVPRADIDRLSTEALMLKELIPMVLNGYYISSMCRLPLVETRLSEVEHERDRELARCETAQKMYNSLMSDYEQERKEKFAFKNEVGELQHMLTQQADYCSSMGSACCMLLWRMSRHEESIQTILSGSKVGEFLQLASSTLLSFLEAYSDSAPPDETHPEAQFVLSLSGTITNIAASTYGRDYLCSCEDGKGLIDTLCSVLERAPFHQQYSKLRNLVLMALYNISINQAGVGYLTSKSTLLPALVLLLKEESDCINRLHILRLIQSLILEQENVEFLHLALDVIPTPLIQHFTTHLNTEIQNTSVELLRDLAVLRRQLSAL